MLVEIPIPPRGSYRRKWTFCAAWKETRRFSRVVELRAQNQSLLLILQRRGWYDAMTSHMAKNKRNRSLAGVTAVASEFTHRGEFKREANSDYVWARRNGHLDEVCAHMDRYYSEPYSKQDCASRAALCEYRSEFEDRFASHVMKARIKGWMDEICAHMDRKSSGFNDRLPGTAYYVRFEPEGMPPAYKIGITNNENPITRFSHKADRSIATVLWSERFPVGRDARSFEQDVLQSFKAHRYDGANFLVGGGITECFSIDVFGVDA